MARAIPEICPILQSGNGYTDSRVVKTGLKLLVILYYRAINVAVYQISHKSSTAYLIELSMRFIR